MILHPKQKKLQCMLIFLEFVREQAYIFECRGDEPCGFNT